MTREERLRTIREGMGPDGPTVVDMTDEAIKKGLTFCHPRRLSGAVSGAFRERKAMSRDRLAFGGQNQACVLRQACTTRG